MITLLFILFCLGVSNISANDSEGYTLNIASLKSNLKYHQLNDYKLMTHYYDTVNKKIALDDGRKMTCSVPLGDLEDHIVEFPEVVEELKGERAESVIVHFYDTCTRYRTNEFLWEFCPGKYFRQYDDKETIANAKKPRYELFFLGFAEGADREKYLKVINSTTGNFSPVREHADKNVYAVLVPQPYVQTLGHLARLSDKTHDFYLHKETNSSHEYMYVLTVYVPVSEIKNENIVINPAGETLEKYVKGDKKNQVTTTKDGVTYYLLERLIRTVLCPELILLEEEFPFNIATSHFDIHHYNNAKIEKKKTFDHTQVYREASGEYHLYKNYLYGPPEFLSQVNSSRSVILFLNRTHAEHRLIVTSPNDGVLELNKGVGGGSQSRELLDIVVIQGDNNFLNNQDWTFKSKRIWMFGTVLIGEKTKFTNEFERCDLIFLMDSNLKTSYAREVFEVISDTLMIVRTKKTVPQVATVKSGYFMGRYHNHTEQISEIKKARVKQVKKSFKDPALSHINTEIKRSMYMWGGDEEGYLECNPSQKFVKSESWILTFSLNLLSLDGSLMIHFGQEECQAEGIEVYFYKMEKLIVRNYGEKGNFQTIQLKAIHLQALMSHDPIWILFDKGMLRIGMGSEVSEASQITFFESEKYRKLSYFSLNKMFSYSVRINNIEVRTPSGDVVETLKRMKEVPKLSGMASYFENYTGGTMCGATQKEREVTVEYVCGKAGEFLKIENITEPSTCQYHLLVGSHLLCPEEVKISHKYMDISKQINCVV